MLGNLTVGVVWMPVKDAVNIYIGRASKYGKSPLACPYPISATCTREQAIEQYEEYLINELNQGNTHIVDEMKHICTHLGLGNNVNLQCYCKGRGHEDRQCHGDVIKAILDEVVLEFQDKNQTHNIKDDFK